MTVAERRRWSVARIRWVPSTVGLQLTKELVGVAHKTLPCGTMVELSYRGRSIVAPVVDRGPYAKGMSWDLTSAAAEQLGFTGTGRIGALVQGGRAS